MSLSKKGWHEKICCLSLLPTAWEALKVTISPVSTTCVIALFHTLMTNTFVFCFRVISRSWRRYGHLCLDIEDVSILHLTHFDAENYSCSLTLHKFTKTINYRSKLRVAQQLADEPNRRSVVDLYSLSWVPYAMNHPLDPTFCTDSLCIRRLIRPCSHRSAKNCTFEQKNAIPDNM